MIVIGELINCARKSIRERTEQRDAAYIRDVALRQVEAGAHMLDVNGGIPRQEAESLEWLVNVVQDTVDVPLCLDSSDPGALERALTLCRQPPMINSITEEPERIAALLPLVKKSGLKVIALCISESGPATGVEARLATARRLIDLLAAEGVPLADIYVDPCAMPLGAGPEEVEAVLEVIPRIMAEYPGVHTSVGVSNVSFGLPARKLLNRVYLPLLMARGLDAVVVDPCDRQIMMNIIAAEALLGRDEFCMEYLRAFRQGKLEPIPVGGGGPQHPAAPEPRE